MQVRSSLRSALLLAVGAFGGQVACGQKAPPPPEADPAKVTTLAKQLLANMPHMAAVRECKDADYAGTLPMTYRSLTLLAGDTPSREAFDADWVNPTELDAAEVRVLLDSKDPKLKRRAAVPILDAKGGYLVYKVDVVNAPMALGIKELKIGTVLTRVIRFEHDTVATCVGSVDFQNDRKKSDWAIEASDKPGIDPAVVKALQDDLAAQYVKNAPRPLAVPPPKK